MSDYKADKLIACMAERYVLRQTEKELRAKLAEAEKRAEHGHKVATGEIRRADLAEARLAEAVALLRANHMTERCPYKYRACVSCDFLAAHPAPG